MNFLIINYESLLVISPNVFSIILISDSVPGRSQLVISPDVLPIIKRRRKNDGRSFMLVGADW